MEKTLRCSKNSEGFFHGTDLPGAGLMVAPGPGDEFSIR